MKYIPRPNPVEAMQVSMDVVPEIVDWLHARYRSVYYEVRYGKLHFRFYRKTNAFNDTTNELSQVYEDEQWIAEPGDYIVSSDDDFVVLPEDEFCYRYTEAESEDGDYVMGCFDSKKLADGELSEYLEQLKQRARAWGLGFGRGAGT